jgi:hypothetical protein
MDVTEINTTMELQRVQCRWWTKDEQVFYQKTKEGWEVDTISWPIWKAFAEYGLIHQQAGTNSFEHTHFSSLKAARQAVKDVSLEAGLSIDSRLTRGKLLSYKIGDLPLSIKRNGNHWRVYPLIDELVPSFEKHFNDIKAFYASWYATGPVAIHYPTQKAAHQAVVNWISQTITKGK